YTERNLSSDDEAGGLFAMSVGHTWAPNPSFEHNTDCIDIPRCVNDSYWQQTQGTWTRICGSGAHDGDCYLRLTSTTGQLKDPVKFKSTGNTGSSVGFYAKVQVGGASITPVVIVFDVTQQYNLVYRSCTIDPATFWRLCGLF